MGRIKTQLLKRATLRLMKEHGGEMTDDFGKNKELIAKFLDVPSKKFRNIIAGYATRLVKVMNKKE